MWSFCLSLHAFHSKKQFPNTSPPTTFLEIQPSTEPWRGCVVQVEWSIPSNPAHTDRAVAWPAAVTEKSLVYLDSQYKVTNPRVKALSEDKPHRTKWVFVLFSQWMLRTGLNGCLKATWHAAFRPLYLQADQCKASYHWEHTHLPSRTAVLVPEQQARREASLLKYRT